MGVPENIDALLVKFDITQEALARAAGVTPGSVTGWRKGSKPRKDALRNLCERFNLTEDDILSDQYGLAAKEHYWQRAYKNSLRPVASTGFVPLVGYTHMGAAVDEETCERTVEVPSEVIKRHPNGFCVHADGDCMNNRYPSDSILLIDPDMQPRNGCAVLAELEGYRSIVRSYQRGSSTLMLSPDSHTGDYEDVIVRADDEPVRLLGVVVWYQAETDLL